MKRPKAIEYTVRPSGQAAGTRSACQEGTDASGCLEKEMLKKINELGIGPQGFGRRTTAIGLNIEIIPTHIAGMPCAININCHVTRQFAGDKFEKRRAEIKEQ